MIYVEEKLRIRPCIGCGYCCKEMVCAVGVFEIADRNIQHALPCPLLMFYGDKYRCRLAFESAEGAKKIGAKTGCCSPFNTDRQNVPRSTTG